MVVHFGGAWAIADLNILEKIRIFWQRQENIQAKLEIFWQL